MLCNEIMVVWVNLLAVLMACVSTVSIIFLKASVLLSVSDRGVFKTVSHQCRSSLTNKLMDDWVAVKAAASDTGSVNCHWETTPPVCWALHSTYRVGHFGRCSPIIRLLTPTSGSEGTLGGAVSDVPFQSLSDFNSSKKHYFLWSFQMAEVAQTFPLAAEVSSEVKATLFGSQRSGLWHTVGNTNYNYGEHMSKACAHAYQYTQY